MTIGMGLGIESPACFASEAQLLAAGLLDGTLWILYDPSTGAVSDSGIWPDGPRNGAPDCGPGVCLVVLDNSNWRYSQAIGSSGAVPIVPYEPDFVVIDNATPPA